MRLSHLIICVLLASISCVTTAPKETSLYECQKICAAVTEGWCHKEVKKNRGCSPQKKEKELQFCLQNQCAEKVAP